MIGSTHGTQEVRAFMVAFEAETIFLRCCAEFYESEIGFSREVEDQMGRLGISWPDIHQAWLSGTVIWSEKEDADSTKSIMIGTTCDDERLRLTLRWGVRQLPCAHDEC